MDKYRLFYGTDRPLLLASVMVLLALTLVVSNRTSSTHGQDVRMGPARFVDNNDGTVTDRQTRLMWEKKQDLGWPGYPPFDEIHAVGDHFTWAAVYSCCWQGRPYGTLWDAFLMRLNRADDYSTDGGLTIVRRTYGDWRIPNILELKSIQDPSKPNCLDPIFGPVVAPGLTSAMFWSSTSDHSSPDQPTNLLVINCADAQVYSVLETERLYVRAVRGHIQLSDLGSR